VLLRGVARGALTYLVRKVIFFFLVPLQGTPHVIKVARCPEGCSVVVAEYLDGWLVIAVSGGRGCLVEGTFPGRETPGKSIRDGGGAFVVHLEHVVAYAVVGCYKLRITVNYNPLESTKHRRDESEAEERWISKLRARVTFAEIKKRRIRLCVLSRNLAVVVALPR